MNDFPMNEYYGRPQAGERGRRYLLNDQEGDAAGGERAMNDAGVDENLWRRQLRGRKKTNMGEANRRLMWGMNSGGGDDGSKRMADMLKAGGNKMTVDTNSRPMMRKMKNLNPKYVSVMLGIACMWCFRIDYYFLLSLRTTPLTLLLLFTHLFYL